MKKIDPIDIEIYDPEGIGFDPEDVSTPGGDS